MAPYVNPRTLFHLIPLNDVAIEALSHPDNKAFVSQGGPKGEYGLEVGFHVPSSSRSHVITKIGRNTDLILRKPGKGVHIASVHVALEVHPVTHLILLLVRSNNVRYVIVSSERNDRVPEVEYGGRVILFGETYRVDIASYRFKLVWRQDIPLRHLRVLAWNDYQDSLERAKHLTSREREDSFDQEEPKSWHMTRLYSVKKAVVREVEDGERPRESIGSGSYGTAYKVFDHYTGHPFVVKVFTLFKLGNKDYARAVIHREIKVLERLEHENIIEYLGSEGFHTDEPRIFMPLRLGNLTNLVEASKVDTHDGICEIVLHQMLKALDYLEYNQVCHRDVKPDNILYKYNSDGQLHFQLADFGLANHRLLAKTTCGTGYFQAPELYPQYGDFPQSPKMDVWSLVATLLYAHAGISFPHPKTESYKDIVRAVQVSATAMPKLRPMARVDPTKRPCAGRMLIILFKGEG